MTRRQLIDLGSRAMLATVALSGGTAWSAAAGRSGPRQGRRLRMLILGGTGFLGPHQVAYALDRGHEVTIFTRGRTTPSVHADAIARVERLVGDRADDLSALAGREWDAVIDNSGRRVEWTRDSAELLRDRVERYVYTSSTGVYYPYLGSDIGEDTELVMDVPDGIDEEQGVEYRYGVMKARSEREARRVFGADRTLVVRPTYMMGPGDRTDRFTYWPVRLARGGEVLVPGFPDDPVQYVDARDVAGWMIRLVEEGTTGTLNAVGPASPTGMQAFVHGAHAAFASAVAFVPVPDYEFLRAREVTVVVPWIMPTGDNVGSARVSTRRAIEAGLTYTPLADSVRDIHAWWHSDAVSAERRARLTSAPESLMARESSIIAAWRSP